MIQIATLLLVALQGINSFGAAVLAFAPGNNTGSVRIFVAGREVNRHRASILGNYVPAWKAVAVIAGGSLYSVGTSNARLRASVALHGANSAFAVNGTGLLLAEYDADHAELFVSRLADGKVLLRLNAKTLRSRGFPVTSFMTADESVVFTRGSDAVLVTFPSRSRPDSGGMVPPVTLRVGLDGRVKSAGLGAPLGVSEGTVVRLITHDGSRIVRVGYRDIKLPGASQAQALNGDIVILADAGSQLSLQLVDSRGKRTAGPSLPIPWSEFESFTLLPLAGSTNASAPKDSTRRHYLRYLVCRFRSAPMRN